jgi:DNA-binding NarL/FixJ family response regulator
LPDDPVTCVVADDHPAVLRSLAEVLEGRGFAVVARAGDGGEALEKIVEHAPDVAVVDLRMPRLSGIQVARSVLEECPRTAVVVYADAADRPLLAEALDAGVRGVVLKEAPLDDVLRAVDVAARGSTYIDPVLAGHLVASGTGTPHLTQREREVLRLLADGCSNEEIGNRLTISPETVRTHVRKAMDKLDAGTRTQAVATALRQSLIV